jgi:hypothetical protein
MSELIFQHDDASRCSGGERTFSATANGSPAGSFSKIGPPVPEAFIEDRKAPTGGRRFPRAGFRVTRV